MGHSGGPSLKRTATFYPDDGLQFAFMILGDLAAKDRGNFIVLADGAISIQEPGSG
jgi:hypothetical protein